MNSRQPSSIREDGNSLAPLQLSSHAVTTPVVLLVSDLRDRCFRGFGTEHTVSNAAMGMKEDAFGSMIPMFPEIELKLGVSDREDIRSCSSCQIGLIETSYLGF